MHIEKENIMYNLTQLKMAEDLLLPILMWKSCLIN